MDALGEGNENIFLGMVMRIRVKLGLILLAIACAADCEAGREVTFGGPGSQMYGDCGGPSLPLELNSFGHTSGEAILAEADLKFGELPRASLPLDQSKYVHLVEAKRFHAVKRPIWLNPGAPLIAGGFLALHVSKSGLYELALGDGAADLVVFHARTATALSPLVVGSVPCAIGLVSRYWLTPGAYIVQIASFYSASPIMEFAWVK